MMHCDDQSDTGEQALAKHSGQIASEVVEDIVALAIDKSRSSKGEIDDDPDDNPVPMEDKMSGLRVEEAEQSASTNPPKIPFLASKKSSGANITSLQQCSLSTIYSEQQFKDRGTQMSSMNMKSKSAPYEVVLDDADLRKARSSESSKAHKMSVLLDQHSVKQKAVSAAEDLDTNTFYVMKGSSATIAEKDLSPKKPRIRILTSGIDTRSHQIPDDVIKSTMHDYDSETSCLHLPLNQNQQIEVNAGLQNLPDQLLDAVLRWLPFADVSRVGGTCRSLRRVAAALLRREIRSLVARTEALMSTLEEETSTQAQSGACMVPVVMRVILHTVLRVLLGEARVLRAVCWRYVRMEDVPMAATESAPAGGAEAKPPPTPPTAGAAPGGGRSSFFCVDASPILCFPGGDVLDEFERLLALVSYDNFRNDIDPEVVTGLFMRMEKFLDYFEGSVEPLLRCGLTPFGVKVLDLLGACDTADCVLSVTHGASDRPFLATVTFELRDASAVDSPPPFDGQMPSHMRLRLLARYLRNNVRWVNFFRPMRELWDLQDEIENRWAPSATGEHRDISRHHTLHQVVMEAVKAKIFRRNINMPPPRPSPPHLPRKQIRQREMYEQLVLRAEPPLWRETFSRRINPAARSLRLGLGCTLELSGVDKSLLPLDLEFLDAERVDSATRHPGLSPQTSNAQPALAVGRTLAADAAEFCEVVGSTPSGTSLKELGGPGAGSATLNVPAQLPLPPTPARGEAMPDWGPWLRLRRSYCAPDAQNGQAPDGWDDYGASLRSGGAYGFRGEVRVTFPPRALSSIVTETVIQVHDTSTETNITSDRRFSSHVLSTRHVCVFPLNQS